MRRLLLALTLLFPFGAAAQLQVPGAAAVSITYPRTASGSTGVSFTDGTHTVSNATALAVTGGTIGGTTPNATLLISGGSTIPFWVLRDDNAGTAPTAGGTGNAAGDLLTLNDSCSTHGVLAVVAVSSGAVTQFLVSNRGSCATEPSGALSVLSSTGSGTGATFTLNYVPGSTANTFAGANAAVNGQMILGNGAGLGQQNAGLGMTGFGFDGMGGGGNNADGMGGGSGLVAAANEDSGFGYKTLTQCVTCEFLTATGLNAGGHTSNGALEDYFGTDSGKYDNNSSDVSLLGVNDGKYAWNLKGVTTVGPIVMSGQFINPTVTGAVSNGGLVRLTVPTTNITTNDCVFVNSVGGVTGANTNGTCVYVTVINSTTLDLQGTTFGGTYTSGGSVIDLPAGFSNQPITGAVTNGGLIKLTVPNTINIVTGDTVYVSGVTGTTEANGTWTVTATSAQCTSTPCYLTLQGSTFTNAYVSGGRITDLNGPRNMMLGGYNVLSGNITGAMSGLTILGSTAAASAVSLGDSTIIGNGCATGTLGSTGNNYGIILICVDSSSDVASASNVDSIGIGQAIGLGNTSVQIGYGAGFHNSVTSAATRNTLVGFENAFLITGAVELSAYGEKVGSVVCRNPLDVLLLGTNASTDCGSSGESNAIHIGAGAADIISATGTGTPSTSATKIAGTLNVAGALTNQILTPAKTSNYSVLSTDSGTHFTNTGASGEVDFSLPAAAAGLIYCFTVDAAQTVKAIAATGEKIAIGTSNSASAGNVTATAAFSTVCIQSHKAAQWEATSSTGTWTVN